MTGFLEFMEPVVGFFDKVWAWVETLINDFGLVYAAIIVGALYIIAKAFLTNASRKTAVLISAIPGLIVIYCILRWLEVF